MDYVWAWISLGWTFLDVFLSPLLQIQADFGLDLDMRGVGRSQSSLKRRN